MISSIVAVQECDARNDESDTAVGYQKKLLPGPGLTLHFLPCNCDDLFSGMALLTVHGISKIENGNVAVSDVSFVQQPLQKIAIAGETGSGKTSLLKMIAGWVQPDAGEILFGGNKVVGPEEQLIPGHPGIAYLSQYFELRHNMWVHEVMEYANEWEEEEARQLYALCRIQHLFNRRTDQLSGGEMQRIALARLLTMRPKLLLLDEPFSNLDMIHKNIIRDVIRDIGDKLKISCIMVSHDAPDILSWADIILVMKDGELVQQGTAEQVYRQPANEYCAGLLGEYNLIDTLQQPAFGRIAGNEQHNKKLMLRPEQIFIATAGENAIKANVVKILFRGSHYSIDALVNGQSLRLYTKHNRYSIWDDIYLSFDAENNWYL